MNIIIPKNKKELKNLLNDSLYKNSYFLMTNTIVGAGAGYIFWLVVARFYSPLELGLATAIISAINLIAMFSVFGLDFGLIRYLPDEEDKQSLINSCLTMVGLSSLVITLIFLLGLNLWSPPLVFIRENIIYLILFIIFTLSISLLSLQSNVFIAFRNTKYVFIQNLITTLRLPLVILLIGFGVLGVFFSYGVGIFMALIIGPKFIAKIYPSYRLKPTIKKSILSEMLNYSFGNYLATVFETAPRYILPLLIVFILDVESAAYFYISWSISALLLMVPRATSFSLFAEGSFDKNNLRKNAIKAIRFIFLLLIPMICGVLFFGNYVLSIFGDVYSKNAFQMLLLLAIASIPYSVNATYITTKRVNKKTNVIINTYGFIAIFTIVVSYLLMIKIGLIGVGIAWISAQSIVALAISMRYLFRR